MSRALSDGLGGVFDMRGAPFGEVDNSGDETSAKSGPEMSDKNGPEASDEIGPEGTGKICAGDSISIVDSP